MKGKAEMLKKVSAFAVDLDGTTWLGNRLTEGARDFLAVVRRRGYRIVFVTNNSSKSAIQYAQKLKNLGLEVDQHEVLTSGQATAMFLKSNVPQAKVFLVGTRPLLQEFQAAGVHIIKKPSEANTVVLGFDTGLTYNRLKVACHLLRHGLLFVATHPDVVCPTPQGPIPDVGSMLALIEAATGRKPDEICGKPRPAMVKAICERLGEPLHKIAFVGDRLYTDVRMARETGMLSILVLSGETKKSDLANAEYTPNLVCENLLDLARLLEALR